MASHSNFRQYLVAKSSPTLVSKDIISLSTPSSNVSKAVQLFVHSAFTNDVNLDIFHKTSMQNLGPGHYSTPKLSSGPSCSFGYSKRFENKTYINANLSKSPNKIKQNKDLNQYKPLQKSISNRERFKKKHLLENINKRINCILNTEKTKKIKDKINEKLHRIEKRTYKDLRNSIARTYATVFVFMSIAQVCNYKISCLKSHKLKVYKAIKFFSTVSRALGKFKVILKRARVRISLNTIRKHLIPALIIKKKAIREVFIDRIESFIGGFINSCSVPKIMFLITQRVRLIQKRFRDYIETNSVRKYFILKLWEKYDQSTEQAPIYIKLYYIHNHIRNQILKFLKSKYEINDLFTSIPIDTQKNHLEAIYGRIKVYKTPVLQLYTKPAIKDLIKKAYLSKPAWVSLFPATSNQSDHPEKPLKVSKTLPRPSKRIKLNIIDFKPKTKKKTLKIKTAN
jgi:uncharacterized protein with HEPN domain